MNMFARFGENPEMTLQDIKETKRYGRTDARTDNVKRYTHHKQSLRGYNKIEIVHALKIVVHTLKYLLLCLCVKYMYPQFYLNKLDNPCILTTWCQ